MQKNRRVLAHYVVCNGRVYTNSILGLDSDGGYQVEPFMHEMASTEFVSGVVAVCDAGIDMALVKSEFCTRSSMSEFAQWLVPYSDGASEQKLVVKFHSDGTIS